METIMPARTFHHARIRLESHRTTEFIRLTDHLIQLVNETKIRVGVLNVQTTHTTTAIVVNEHEPLLLADFQESLERIAPDSGGYAHDNLAQRGNVPAGEPLNGCAHNRALLLPTSASLNIVGGRITLGRWQQVFLVELDGPREREVSIVIVGEGAP